MGRLSLSHGADHGDFVQRTRNAKLSRPFLVHPRIFLKDSSQLSDPPTKTKAAEELFLICVVPNLAKFYHSISLFLDFVT